MLARSFIVGIGLGLLCVIAFAVISHCDLTEGCTGESQFSEAFDGLMENVFGAEGAGDTVKTKPIPPSSQPVKQSAKRPDIEAARPLPRENRPAIPVDSYSAGDQYDILKWNLVPFSSGSVDSVRTGGGIASAEGSLAISNGDYLIISGWAGHPAYGMRFRDVLFSLCGKVVGRAAVTASRPDVATAVHRNLARSGWTVRLAANHLPRCKEQVLQAWGVAPIGFNIFPLIGKTAITLLETAEPVSARFQSRSAMLTPAQNGKAELKKITVSASALRLRKCGDTSCDVVGHIKAGQHDGFVLETVGQWSLFQIGEAVGWASNWYVAIQ